MCDSHMEGCGYDGETVHGDGRLAVTIDPQFKIPYFFKEN